MAAWAQPSVAIRSFVFRQYDGGPAWGAGQTANSGEALVFTFEAAGLKAVEADDEKKVSLEWEGVAVDSKDVPIALPLKTKQDFEIHPEDKDWVPKLTGSVRLPELMGAGKYKVRVVLRDLEAKSETTAEFPFAVAGPALAATSTLAVQRVRFLRREEDEHPLDAPAYVAGDVVWVRFEMTGFAASPEREVHVRYGLRVSNATGKVVLDQPAAAEESKKFFYPPAYLPGVVSLTLDQKVPRGQYSLTLRIEDVVSKSTAESTHSFAVQ